MLFSLKKFWIHSLVFASLFAFSAGASETSGLNSRVKIGFNFSNPPYANQNSQGHIEGFTVDLINAVARHANLELVEQAGSWEIIKKALESGHIDMVSAMVRSPEREKIFDFSDVHSIGFDAIFVRETERSIKSEDDLRGKRLILLSGGIPHEYFKTMGVASEIIPAETLHDGFVKLSEGKGDAFIGAQIPALLTLEKLNQLKLRLAERPLIQAYTREYAFGVRKGQPDLVNRLNEGLRAVRATGEYNQIYRKWLSNIDPHAKKRERQQQSLLFGLLVAVGAVSILSILVLIFRREVRRKTRSLAASERTFRGLVENLPGAVYKCSQKNGKWGLDYISEAIEKITGYPPRYFTSHSSNLADIVHPDDLKTKWNPIARAIDELERYETDFRVIARDGEIRWIHSRGKIEFNEVTKEKTLDGLFLDTTEQHQVAELLTEQQSKLASTARLSALGEMAGGIAHEINNPLAIINLRMHQLNQMADKGPVASEDIRKIASGVESTSIRISKIIKSLKTVARESAQDPFEVVSVKAIINDALELCYQRMRKHGIEISLSEIREGLEIECKRVQISQVLINLLNNAFDAVVSLSERFVRISVVDLGRELEISIADSGRGILPEVSQKIFQPFFTTKDVGKGTGLGLSISKGLIESHKGSIWLDTKHESTRFVIRLPKYQNAAAEISNSSISLSH